MRHAMKNGNVLFVEPEDEASLYGQKIDVQIWSVIGKEFSLATNQVDFAQPARFDLKFTNKEGNEEVPLCIHRAPLSTHERMIGFLIEHYGGNFPVWLAPVPACVFTIPDRQIPSSQQVFDNLLEAGVRVQKNFMNAKLGFKIREAQLQKVPYMLVIGDKEVESATITPRFRDGKNLQAMTTIEFADFLKQEVASFH